LSICLFTFTAPEQYIWFALAGALIAGPVAFGVSSIGGWKASPLSQALAGTAVTAFLQAMTNAVVLLDTTALDTYRFWVVGSVIGRDAAVLWQVFPLDASVLEDPASGRLMVVPIGTRHVLAPYDK
jgi:iron complex transport system permease protein